MGIDIVKLQIASTAGGGGAASGSYATAVEVEAAQVMRVDLTFDSGNNANTVVVIAGVNTPTENILSRAASTASSMYPRRQMDDKNGAQIALASANAEPFIVNGRIGMSVTLTNAIVTAPPVIATLYLSR